MYMNGGYGYGRGRIPIASAYREAFPGSFRGWTIAGAYPAQTKAPMTTTMPTAAAAPTPTTAAPPIPMPSAAPGGGIMSTLMGNKVYVIGAIAIVGVIIGILYFTGKKGRRKKLI